MKIKRGSWTWAHITLVVSILSFGLMTWFGVFLCLWQPPYIYIYIYIHTLHYITLHYIYGYYMDHMWVMKVFSPFTSILPRDPWRACWAPADFLTLPGLSGSVTAWYPLVNWWFNGDFMVISCWYKTIENHHFYYVINELSMDTFKSYVTNYQRVIQNRFQTWPVCRWCTYQNADFP